MPVVLQTSGQQARHLLPGERSSQGWSTAAREQAAADSAPLRVAAQGCSTDWRAWNVAGGLTLVLRPNT